MTRPPPSWQTLNAYVDGALDAAAAAGVAEAAGNDPAIAAQIAGLYQLKGVSHAAFPAAPDELKAKALPRRRRRGHLAGIVAALLAVAAVLAGLWLGGFWSEGERLGLRPEGGALPGDLVATARRLHGEWLASAEARADDPPATLITALSHFRQLPTVPDLESARLTVAQVRFADRDGAPVLQVGYLGHHGCHLSLFVFAAPGHLPDRMVRLDSGLERAYGWQAGRLGYMLFARGMDSAMLDLIAHKVEGQTRTHALFDGPTREALADRKRNSARCAA